MADRQKGIEIVKRWQNQHPWRRVINMSHPNSKANAEYLAYQAELAEVLACLESED
jgi:hypothetical protein